LMNIAHEPHLPRKSCANARWTLLTQAIWKLLDSSY
jgi:hypothetical protein